MATIGVYDSGIGGLTTLKILLEKFQGNDFFYLADNAQHPFGTKSEKELDAIVTAGIAKLKNHSDFAVLACNTPLNRMQGNRRIQTSPNSADDE